MSKCCFHLADQLRVIKTEKNKRYLKKCTFLLKMHAIGNLKNLENTFYWEILKIYLGQAFPLKIKFALSRTNEKMFLLQRTRVEKPVTLE